MNSTLIFLITFITGGLLGYLFYNMKLKKEYEKKEEIEEELVKSLKELKSYVAPKEVIEEREFSKDFDLVELALEHNLIDIIVTDEEGLTIATTIKDESDLGPKIVYIFENIIKNFSDTRKVIISKKESYLYIFKSIIGEEPIYIIFESRVMLNPVDEREVVKKIYKIVKDRYLECIRRLESLEEKPILAE